MRLCCPHKLRTNVDSAPPSSADKSLFRPEIALARPANRLLKIRVLANTKMRPRALLKVAMAKNQMLMRQYQRALPLVAPAY